MAAAPSPISMINHRAMANIKIDLTPEGMQAFEILFPAALGALLTATLNHSLANACKPAESPEELSLFAMIFDQLVLCLSDNPKVLVTLHGKAGGHGPRAFQWLISRYNPKTQVTHVKTLLDIFSTSTIDKDEDMEALIAKNNGLPMKPHLQLEEPVMAILIISKLASTRFKPIKDNFIISKNIPNLAELQQQIQAINQYNEGDDHLAFTTIGSPPNKFTMCYNCDVRAQHRTKDCDKPKADCDTCGPEAGHLSKHCLVNSNKPIPLTMPEHVREKIRQDRQQLKQKQALQGNIANMCASVDDGNDDENFWKIIEQGHIDVTKQK
jgi:hypothetical protein